MTYTAGFSPTGLIRDALNKKSDRALSALETRTCHSWKMALDRTKILPEFIDLACAPSLSLFIRAAAGARLTDLDGNVFIDLSMGRGAQILGHNHRAAREAIIAQAARGWNFGLPDGDQLELARLIQAASPANERVVLCNSGADAVRLAIASARAFTGREQVATFGADDPLSDGGDARALRQLGYGQPAALEHIRTHRDELAAIVVEPIRASAPGLDHVDWLRELAAICGECDIPLVFDESFTGFRLAYGGAQELLGVMPDLTCYGRAVGGGLPLGAIAGRVDLLSKVAQPAGAAICSDAGFGPNPMSVAAGVGSLAELHATRAAVYPALNEAGKQLAQEFNGFCASEAMPVVMQAVGSVFRIVFPPSAPALTAAARAETAFYLFALSRSVFIDATRSGFLSAAHRESDLEYIVSALTESLRDVRDDGLFTFMPRS